MKKKVIVGISGGIDSAVAAFILKQKGYLVKGIYINTFQNKNSFEPGLAQISKSIDIPIEIIQAEKEFEHTVIQYFRNQHLAGFSPSLCTYCNPNFKWKILYQQARKKNAELISTGHYIQKEKFRECLFIKKGIDQQKDQSYYLWNLPDEIIQMIKTPLGTMTKQDVKKLAQENNLDFLLRKEESSGLCFSENLTYPELIRKYIPESHKINKGKIIDNKGKVIGEHNGYIYYTVGQKKDLIFYENLNYCVTKVDASNNLLIAGEPQQLWKNQIYISDYNFRKSSLVFKQSNLKVKIRGFGWNPQGFASISKIHNKKVEISFEKPAWAPAPGQTAVIYLDDLLVGGGVIV